MNFINSFLNNVFTNPNKIAIKKGEESITYKELYQQSAKIYSYLKKENFNEKFIGIDSEDGINSYVYIIGIWMYGAAYIPINPLFSIEKNNKIIRESNLKLFFSSKNLIPIKTVLVSDLLDEEYTGKIIHQNFAYLLFTSGTTGVPKGVPISTKNLNAFTNHYLNSKNYNFSNNDIFLQSYELTFDVSVFCFTLPLMLGGTLVLLPDAGIKYLSILQTLQKEKITVTSNVPSTVKFSFNRIDEIEFTNLRYSFFSGEALFGNWAKKWMLCTPNAKTYNCYGPTETTIVCTSELLNSLDESYFYSSLPLPLGDPFSGMELKIIDHEICFSGDLVFPGYLNQNTPQVNVDGKNYFPTGDLAEFDNNGKLIFKGRKDRQIQLNGYRIELDEIDFIIQKHLNCLSKSFLITSISGEQFISTAIESKQIFTDNTFAFLSVELPKYAIPKYFIAIETFPFNNNLKLDLKKLEDSLYNKLFS